MSRWQARKILAMTEIKDFRRDEAVMLQGQEIKYLYVLLEGEIEAWHTRSDGSSYISDVNKPGSVFGILFSDSGQQCFADMVAIKPSRVLRLRWQDIDQISRYFPRVSVKLYRNLSGIIANSFKTIENRFVHSYDELSGAYGTRVFTELLESMYERAGRYNEPLTILAIHPVKSEDIDKRDYNLIIRKTGAIINANLRKPDVFGRWNEECLWVLCPSSSKMATTALKERIKSSLASDELLNTFPIQIKLNIITLHDREDLTGFTGRIEAISGYEAKNQSDILSESALSV